MPCDLICSVLLSHYAALALLSGINQFFRRETGYVYCNIGAALLCLVWMVCGEHVAWLGWVVANLSLQRRGFDARPVRVGFVVDRVAVGQFSLGLLHFTRVSTIPPMLHTHSFTYNPRYIMFPSQYFSFPLSVPFHQCSIPIHSPTTHTI